MFEMKDGYEKKEKISPCKQFTIYYVEFNSEIVGKRCTKCLEMKELNRFGKRSDRATLGGVVSQCKDCKNARSRDYFQENIDMIHEKHQNYRDNNKDKERERGLRYRLENPEKLKEYRVLNRDTLMEYAKNWYAENKEYARDFNKQYYVENREKLIVDRKNYYYANREHALEVVKRWATNNPEKVKAFSYKRRTLKQALPSTLTSEQLNLLMEIQEHKCILSDKADNLHLEHFIPISWGVGGNTFENCYYMDGFINISKGNRNAFEWIKTQPKDYQHRFYHLLVPMLSDRNGMTVEEFTDYIYECEANKKEPIET